MNLKFLASLKLAVFIILGLAASLATATILESLYDTPTAQFYVYRALWFHCLLGLLAVCLIAVMVDRWPWRKKHIPFLLAHLGIVMLLFGSWVTEKYGLDGSMRITEGEASSTVEIDQPMLVLSEGATAYNLPLRWQPPDVKFRPISLRAAGIPYDLVIDQYLSHADADYSFVPSPDAAADRTKTPAGKTVGAFPAVRIKLVGGPMRISQDFWLWRGDPGFSAYQAGPAWLELRQQADKPVAPPGGASRPGPRLSLILGRDGSLSYEAESDSHQIVKGTFAPHQLAGKVIQPGWRGGVSIQLVDFIPDATLKTSFRRSHTEYGEFAPPSAIHVVAGTGAEARMWLGVGSRAILHSGGHDVEIGYFRKQVVLPFAIRLDRFKVDTYEGGQKPSAYSSRVTVIGGDPGKTPSPASGGSGLPVSEFSRLISMNEPLQYRGFTFYQASYEDALPRPVTSILSVNQDPGRRLKYLGSLLIVFGSILLFAMKYRWKPRPGQPKPGPAQQGI